MSNNRHFIPPVSPYGLIQETLWPDEWKILVSCMLLNCTTRKSVEKIIPKLFSKYPDAHSMTKANFDELSSLIAPLGFKNRRAKNIIEMSKCYVKKEWKHANELPGIGVYASAAWEIFVQGTMPKECPNDHALSAYWRWCKSYS